MRKKELLKQSISLVLAGIMVFQGPLSECGGTQVWARSISDVLSDTVETAPEFSGTPEAAVGAEIVEEDISKREEAEKHFYRSDCSMEAGICIICCWHKS